MEKKSFVVGPETERMIGLGHPWIIADRYTRGWSKGHAGDLIPLHNAKNELLGTALYDPGERIVARLLGFGPLSLTQAWIRDRLENAAALRRNHALWEEDTDAFRVVNGEGDGLPGLTIDRYGDFILLQLYTRSWEPHLPVLCQAIEKVFQPVGIYEKFRPQQTRQLAGRDGNKKLSRLAGGGPAPRPLVVQENGLKYQVDLNEGLNTGLFFDQRQNRIEIRQRAAGKKVLNLFAYTGSFSVAAAAGGASRVVTVDVSPTYLDWARENFNINRLNPKRHDFLQGDCFEVVKSMRQSGDRFDLVVMDPPSFSTTSKSRFTTTGGTAELLTQVLDLLVPGGVLMCSSNHQKVDFAAYLKELRKGALAAAGSLQVIKTTGQPEDFPFPVTFPEGQYLKCVTCIKTA